jgi:hypothetical protein
MNLDLEKKVGSMVPQVDGVSMNFAKENLQLRKKIAKLEMQIFNN